MPKIPMPKPGTQIKWKEPSGGGGNYKSRPMNPENGTDDSPSSKYGAEADPTFDKGRGTGTTGTKTWAETNKELKDSDPAYKY